MAYYFFFSYKRVVDTAYLQKFFEDLSAELRAKLELADDAEVGFFDQKGIELGEEWEPTIADALQESKVLVCAYSPRYFESEYCGKEWQVFQLRREEHQRLRQAAGEPNARLAAVIKPVLWLPLTDAVDGKFKSTQYLYGDPQAVQNKQGLRHVVKRLNVYGDLYTDLVEWLADEIIAANAHNLPRLPNLPSLRQVPSAFAKQPPPPPPPGVGPPPPPPPPPAGSTKHVRFIFVAGDPSRFGGQRQPDAYLQRGGPDWRPFHPKVSDRIARIVQHFVSTEEMDFDSDVVPFGDDLVSVVEESYRRREIVIILVDAWTLAWDQGWRDILWDFDNNQRPFYNCSVLVPWNEADLELQGQRDQIVQTVRDTFASRANLWKNPVFYRDSIDSVPDLLAALRDALVNIRAELHKRAEERRPVPAGISKPVVSNQPPQAEGGL
jgi:FxsC-like protein